MTARTGRTSTLGRADSGATFAAASAIGARARRRDRARLRPRRLRRLARATRSSIPYGEHPALAGVDGRRPRRHAGRRHARRPPRRGARRAAPTSTKGTTLRTVTFATRVLGRLGVKMLILTNAAGGINTALQAGHADGDRRSHQPDGQQPAGRRRTTSGSAPRFPDMTEVYSPRLRGVADDAARGARHRASRTASTSRCTGRATRRRPRSGFLRTIGADAVGMSTVPEAIVARHMGIEVLGISCITNTAAGVLPQPLDARRSDGGGAARARRILRAARGRSLSEL